VCRCVADTLYKTTYLDMLSSNHVHDAVFDTMRHLCYNALDISLLPHLHDRLIQRLVQFEPILALATIGLCIDVPVISMLSIKQFLDGQTVDDREEYDQLRNFCALCWNKKMFMNKVRSCLWYIAVALGVTDVPLPPTGHVPRRLWHFRPQSHPLHNIRGGLV
jgi:hypothetical protein